MTTAPTTTFCVAKAGTIIPGLFLWVDGNQKISMGGTYIEPLPNALSLRYIDDCPYASETCKKACYVQGLSLHAPSVYALYEHNSDMLRAAMRHAKDGLTRDANALARGLAGWINRNCSNFRWHVSGDVFSEGYANWIVTVCLLTPTVQHWTYTRSLPYIKNLALANNITINVSCDADNYQDALNHDWEDVPGGAGRVNFTYLTTTGEIPDEISLLTNVIFPDYSLRGDMGWRASLPAMLRKTICPVDFHGKSEKNNCRSCRKCL